MRTIKFDHTNEDIPRALGLSEQQVSDIKFAIEGACKRYVIGEHTKHTMHMEDVINYLPVNATPAMYAYALYSVAQKIQDINVKMKLSHLLGGGDITGILENKDKEGVEDVTKKDAEGYMNQGERDELIMQELEITRIELDNIDSLAQHYETWLNDDKKGKNIKSTEAALKILELANGLDRKCLSYISYGIGVSMGIVMDMKPIGQRKRIDDIQITGMGGEA